MPIFVESGSRVSVVAYECDIVMLWQPQQQHSDDWFRRDCGVVVFKDTKVYTVVNHDAQPAEYTYDTEQEFDEFLGYSYPEGLEILCISKKKFNTQFHVIGTNGAELVSMVPDDAFIREYGNHRRVLNLSEKA